MADSLHNSEKKDRMVAAVLSLFLTTVILLLGLWIKFTTPLPPFPETGGQGIEVNFGTFEEGTGHVEADQTGDQQNSPASSSSPDEAADNTTTVSNDEEPTLNIKKTIDKTTVNKKITKPVEEPKPSSELSNALNKLKNHKTGEQGGDGNSGQAGNSGDPNGNPNTHGEGGSGGTGKGNFPGYSLAGRTMTKRPEIVDDSHEEGKVVVEIIVDENGKVIKATAGERGSTTTNAILFAKARQAALTARFSPSPEGIKEQRGTITFVFILD